MSSTAIPCRTLSITVGAVAFLGLCLLRSGGAALRRLAAARSAVPAGTRREPSRLEILCERRPCRLGSPPSPPRSLRSCTEGSTFCRAQVMQQNVRRRAPRRGRPTTAGAGAALPSRRGGVRDVGDPRRIEPEQRVGAQPNGHRPLGVVSQGEARDAQVAWSPPGRRRSPSAPPPRRPPATGTRGSRPGRSGGRRAAARAARSSIFARARMHREQHRQLAGERRSSRVERLVEAAARRRAPAGGGSRAR